jgi:hypothetical protein
MYALILQPQSLTNLSIWQSCRVPLWQWVFLPASGAGRQVLGIYVAADAVQAKHVFAGKHLEQRKKAATYSLSFYLTGNYFFAVFTITNPQSGFFGFFYQMYIWVRMVQLVDFSTNYAKYMKPDLLTTLHSVWYIFGQVVNEY